MTREAPSHLKAGGARRIARALDRSMAIHTSHFCLEMHLVGEVHEIGKALQPHPWNRFPFTPMRKKLFSFRTWLFNRLMTSHAQRDGRDRRHRRIGSMTVTEQAIHLKFSGMKLVAEIYGLAILDREIGASRRVQSSQDAGCRPGQQEY